MAGNEERRSSVIIFLPFQQHKSDIRGTVLEIGTTVTVRKYGGTHIVWADALDLTAHSPEITLVDDLSHADNVASDHYDCFVNQFTIQICIHMWKQRLSLYPHFEAGRRLADQLPMCGLLLRARAGYGHRRTPVYVFVVYAHSS